MTNPCVNEDQFDMVNGAISPKHFMQWRHVATNTASGVDRNYPPFGPAINDPIHTVQVAWTNTSPIAQKVYGLITRGGSKVVLMARSRAYLEQSFGTALGVSPADPATSTELSRFGVGYNTPLLPSGNTFYAVLETRSGDRTALIGDTVTVPPGQTYKIRCALAFKSEFWEPASSTSGGGGIEMEARITSGATQLDMYAYPYIP